MDVDGVDTADDEEAAALLRRGDKGCGFTGFESAIDLEFWEFAVENPELLSG